MPSPFLYPPPDVKQPVIIREDGGGEVREYEWAMNKYNAERRRVEIRGSCRSACSMALGVKNVCVAPGAVVKLHQAYEKATGVIREDVTNLMTSYMPMRVRNHVEGHITRNYNPYTTLYYDDLIKLGIKSCGETRTVQAADRDVSYTWQGLFPMLEWKVRK